MSLTLDQITERYPGLNRRWIMDKAKEGLFRHSRPHRRLFLFDENEFEKDLLSINRIDTSDLDRQVAVEFLKKKHSRK
jgi:hypothetical protein